MTWSKIDLCVKNDNNFKLIDGKTCYAFDILLLLNIIITIIIIVIIVSSSSPSSLWFLSLSLLILSSLNSFLNKSIAKQQHKKEYQEILHKLNL